MSLRGQRGSSVLETAILMSVLLALTLGIVDFGRALFTFGSVAQIAREGARWAIVRGSQCSLLDDCNVTSPEIQSYVQSLAFGPITPSKLTVNATWPGGCPPDSPSIKAPGCLVAVNVTYPFTFELVPYVPNFTINMSSTSQMVISQ
jgi:Flp pilus assembly protein TadG